MITVTLTIDDTKVEVPEGNTILQAADAAEIHIPRLCSYPDQLAELDNEKAKFFAFEEEPMYTKRESELLQMYIQQHGQMPGGGDNELDDLF